MKNKLILALAGALICGSSFAADSKGGPAFMLSDGNGTNVASAVGVINGSLNTPTEGFEMNTSNAGSNVLSMDVEDDPDNIIIDLDIGAGNAIQGISWDVGVATEGGSWLSEAVVKFTSTSDTTTGLFLTVGVGDDGSGDSEYSSGGIISLADNSIPDVTPDADGIIRVQFFEGFDDNADAADATWRDAAAPVVVPGFGLSCIDQAACDQAVAIASGNAVAVQYAVPTLAPIGLGILALGLGVIGMRRRQS
ncbi:MAG: hypothetical protein ACWA5R_07340 [bacterium]